MKTEMKPIIEIIKKNFGNTPLSRSLVWDGFKTLNTVGAIIIVCHKIIPTIIPEHMIWNLKGIVIFFLKA